MAYWTSWIIFATLINFSQLFVLFICGLVFGFELWKNCPFGILFRIFFYYSECVIFGAFLLTTLIQKRDEANRLAFTLTMLIVMIGITFSEPRMTLGIFHNDKVMDNPIIKIFTFVFELFPSYSFNLSIGIINLKATRHFTVNTSLWEPGSPFTWEDYYAERVMYMKITNDKLYVPSIAHYVSCL